MRILRVDIPRGFDGNDGLDHIKMDKLQSVVLIAGENGSGKTRLLQKIKQRYSAKIPLRDIGGINQNIDNLSNSIKNEENNIAAWQSGIERLDIGHDQESRTPNPQTQITQLAKQIARGKNNIQAWKKNLDGLKNSIDIDTYVQTSDRLDSFIAIDYVPKKLNLRDCGDITKNQLVNMANSTHNIGIEGLEAGTFAKIQYVQNKWWSATHPKSSADTSERDNAINDYERLKDLIQLFLNTSLDRTLEDEATLFNLPLGKSNLSDGQKILLQFCMAIYAQSTALKDIVLFMDEPENHLHPSVLIEVIDRLQNHVSAGQIWIATHSVPLLAHFDPSLIWFMADGQITYAGKATELVLSSLLGGEDEIEKLDDFLQLPAQYAASKFAYECLFPPKTLMTEIADPQTNQIVIIIKQIIGSDEPLRILDFGAGKGRLARMIADLACITASRNDVAIDYIAYDESSLDKKVCEDSISSIYQSSDGRYFNDSVSLLASKDEASIHVVVMCNVFHEIDPIKWLSFFSSESIILTLMKDTGYLLIVEDYQLPLGEKAYPKGFLMLDELQIKKLFDIKEKDNGYKIFDAKGTGRLKAHLIPKRFLQRINEDTRAAAIQMVKLAAKQEITRIRNSEPTYKNGKIYGFWLQQYVNSMLALEELSK